jgi:hypothetical protein
MTILQMALMAWMAGTEAQAARPQTKITVYVRDKASINPWVGVTAKTLARQMFAWIGISLEWGIGKPAAEASQLPIFIDLVGNTPAKLRPGAMAYTQPCNGTHITVFYDRVVDSSNPGRVLAHVMVHEIGHVLQGVCRHADSGIMKAKWNIWDLHEILSFQTLQFTREDVDLIYLGLAVRMNGTSLVDSGR